MGLPHAPCRRVDARMPLDLHSTAPLSQSIPRSGTECGLPDGPTAGTDAFPRRLCARVEPCYHARESAVRRPRSAGAPHVPLTALRGPPSGAPARPAGILGTVSTLAAGIRRMVPARSAGIRRLSLPHPEGPPSIPCPAPIDPPPVSALEGMTGVRGPISHVNQIKLAGRFSA